ncbi:hypothetical protein NG791_27915 [Laspinema sp. D1]|uniref:hypothetical protein n=1 Tax=Laspinema palackyanum TaxID=3231601 RepID=UPI003483DDFF|nr:hypothetical protein [Laspinema sp. D2b]
MGSIEKRDRIGRERKLLSMANELFYPIAPKLPSPLARSDPPCELFTPELSKLTLITDRNGELEVMP